VLVHGSLATGAEEWAAQQPLTEQGFELRVFDRRGYGRSAEAPGEDYLADGADVAELLGDGAHIVGHSYGGLGAMLAAAQRPEATRSLTLLEPAAGRRDLQDPAWLAAVAEIESFWHDELPDHDWVVRFLKAVGSDPDQFPPEMLAAAVPLVPVFRNGRPFYDAQLPLDTLREAPFPKLVVSGGHHPGFEGMCRELAVAIGAEHRVIEGAGHEIQFTGEPVNGAMRSLWTRARA
jgi:pimeloyl-ACP methyl ester carboxylesterase